MESLIQFTSEHTHLAHLIFFSLLMLAGLNIPISEDLLVLSGGYIASACPVNQVIPLYLAIFFGCWISSWEAYWIGRRFGPNLYEMRWFKRFITPEKIQKLNRYFEKFGILTFIVGRFIPGGFRNVLFMGAGLGKMKFTTFLARDICGCFLSSLTLFSLGYSFQRNADHLASFLNGYKYVVFFTISALLLALIYAFCMIKSGKQRQDHVE